MSQGANWPEYSTEGTQTEFEYTARCISSAGEAHWTTAQKGDDSATEYILQCAGAAIIIFSHIFLCQNQSKCFVTISVAIYGIVASFHLDDVKDSHLRALVPRRKKS